MNFRMKTRSVTFDDFCWLVGNGEKADLIDGVMHVASPDNTDANRLFLWLAAVIGFFVEARDLGEVYGTRVAFRLDDDNGPEPDIGFVRKNRRHLVKRGYVAGPPDLAVEIVSPESVERDYEKKRKQYQQAGIPEYWIVDEVEQKVVLLRLGPHRRYREVKAKKGVLHSEVLPGFWFRPEWFWQDPLPKMADIVKEILSSSD
jgi:Uma2 family endonuclease